MDKESFRYRSEYLTTESLVVDQSRLLKETLVSNNKKTLPCISIDDPFKHFHKIIRDREQYEECVIGDYIYSILYSKCCKQNIIIEWIRNNLSDNIDSIIEELIKYILKSMESLRFEIFDICCSLNLQKTRDMYLSREQEQSDKEQSDKEQSDKEQSDKEQNDIFIYDKILELHELREELCKYKNKYESVRGYMESMSNGLLYFEANEDYERYMNRIQ
jgi:hypothetical protein